MHTHFSLELLLFRDIFRYINAAFSQTPSYLFHKFFRRSCLHIHFAILLPLILSMYSNQRSARTYKAHWFLTHLFYTLLSLRILLGMHNFYLKVQNKYTRYWLKMLKQKYTYCKHFALKPINLVWPVLHNAKINCNMKF